MTEFTTIPSLLALYRIDHELHEFRNRLTAVLKDQVAIENNIVKLKAELAELESAGRKLQATISSHELDMKIRQEHIEKMRTSLNNAKTNKEYSAILIQISSEKDEIGKMETIILDFMGQLEVNNKAAGATREQLALAETNLADSRRQSSQRVHDIQTHIDELEIRRAQAQPQVPAESRKQYERICKRYPGDAMAPVDFDENDMENITCGGCFMGLNIEDVNLLRGRDEIRRCQSCGRILYMPEMLPRATTTSST
ncbi:MAG: zinc ribbon domain-containing protein [Phycisphaerae bacterium]